MIRLRTLNRSPVARKMRRYRRPLAAALAAVSVLLIVGALRPPAPIVVAEATPTALGPGEVAVPITLANTAMSAVIRSGDHVEVIALTEMGTAQLVSKARIIEVMDGGLVLLAAQPTEAVDLAIASLRHSLAVTIHPQPPSDQ